MKYQEIFKLRKMLDDVGIRYEHQDAHHKSKFGTREFHQVVVMKNDDERLISVVEGDGTYGCECDLLEIMGLLTDKEKACDSVLGYMSAKAVFERIKKAIEVIE